MKRFFASCSLIALVMAVFTFLFWDYFSPIPLGYWLKMLVSVSITGLFLLLLAWALNAIGPSPLSREMLATKPKETKREYLKRRIISHASYEWRPEVVVFFNILDETANDGYSDYCTRKEFLEVLNELKAEGIMKVRQENWTGESLNWIIRSADLKAVSAESRNT